MEKENLIQQTYKMSEELAQELKEKGQYPYKCDTCGSPIEVGEIMGALAYTSGHICEGCVARFK
ncbi:MAG: hypothetical protein I3273_06220 [Candidatus Moeniiplasma glomeromycotorum]|nr:hypothetical protein [Candidatus Moeniiplasma glomeromycotorum]MCE8168012.1 hypothetical protein [Candidatus Moeniiplasma glomeromycotorum]MCE8169680.1 hypothetical protein [Candidatus Moeniiplasma glomeromycotorum]